MRTARKAQFLRSSDFRGICHGHVARFLCHTISEGVIRVVLTVGQPLPVYPGEQTSSDRLGTSQKRQRSFRTLARAYFIGSS